MLEIRNVHKTFNPGTINEKHALNGVNLKIEEGDFVTVIGGNGAGKSTTMKILAGALGYSTGDVKICGVEVSNDPIKTKSFVGYLPEQNPLYAEMYVKEYLLFVAETYGIGKEKHERVDRLIDEVGLRPEFQKKIGQLSKGYRQRVGLAQALIPNPKVLILDEPTTGLHFEDVKVLMEAINKLVDLGNSFVIIEHNLDVIKLADHIIDVGMEGGNKGGEIIAKGTPEEVAKSRKSLTARFLKRELQ